MNALPIGLAKLTRLAFAGVDLSRVAGRLLGMCERDPNHAGALMDLAVIDQLEGNLAIGLKRQAMALSKQRVFRSTCCGANPRLRVLAFVAAADIGANTPLEFLLEGSDIALTMVYVLPGRELPTELPDHDLAFVAIAATRPNRPLLAELEDLLAYWPTPVVNLPGRVSMLEPIELAANLTEAGLRTPTLRRVLRDELRAAATAQATRLALSDRRPARSSNAIERGAEKIDTQDALGLFLGKRSIAPISCRLSSIAEGRTDSIARFGCSSSIAAPTPVISPSPTAGTAPMSTREWKPTAAPERGGTLLRHLRHRIRDAPFRHIRGAGRMRRPDLFRRRLRGDGGRRSDRLQGRSYSAGP